MTKQVAIRVQKDLLKKIEQDAKTETLSTSDIIRRILMRHYGLLSSGRNNGA